MIGFCPYNCRQISWIQKCSTHLIEQICKPSQGRRGSSRSLLVNQLACLFVCGNIFLQSITGQLALCDCCIFVAAPPRLPSESDKCIWRSKKVWIDGWHEAGGSQRPLEPRRSNRSSVARMRIPLILLGFLLAACKFYEPVFNWPYWSDVKRI